MESQLMLMRLVSYTFSAGVVNPADAILPQDIPTHPFVRLPNNLGSGH